MFALDVAPDQSTATIAAAWKRPDGATHVTLSDHQPGVEWVVSRAVELKRRWGGRLIVENNGTAGFLIPALQAAGIRLELVQRHFYADACSALDAAINARRIRHSDDPNLNNAVAAARWYSVSETGQRLIIRKDPRVSPLVAASLALHGVDALKPRPGRLVFFS
jgi:phage terminase large subunit-like protein